MAPPDCGFAYSQARLQARLGLRAQASDWQRLNAARDLAGWLQASAASPLARWTHDLAPADSSHEAERRLRHHWLELVDEVARWQPTAWREATAWLRWLPYLPALEKIARGSRTPDWMRGDAFLGPIVAEDPRQRAAHLQHTACAPLAAGFRAPAGVTGAWLRHWRSLWPRNDPGLRALERLARQVGSTRAEIARLPETATSGAALARLDRALLVAFRRNALSPVATVAWLGMTGLDLLRLRGDAANRTLRIEREGDA